MILPACCAPAAKWPGGRRAADERDELAAFHLIELHSVPASQGRLKGSVRR